MNKTDGVYYSNRQAIYYTPFDATLLTSAKVRNFGYRRWTLWAHVAVIPPSAQAALINHVRM